MSEVPLYTRNPQTRFVPLTKAGQASQARDQESSPLYSKQIKLYTFTLKPVCRQGWCRQSPNQAHTSWRRKPTPSRSPASTPHSRRCIQEQPLRTNVKRFRGELVLKAHRLLYHSTLGWRVTKMKMKIRKGAPHPSILSSGRFLNAFRGEMFRELALCCPTNYVRWPCCRHDGRVV